MKIKNQKSELEYKNYKNLFGKIKKRSKKLHYSKLIIEYSKNVKKPWSVIKEAIGKEKNWQQSFLKRVFVEKQEITDIKSIVENFNNYFAEIGLTLAKKVDSLSLLLINI